MLKKISVKDLTTGMFIQKLDGNWLKHPFWKTAFPLNNPKDINAIKTAGISHVWIDTKKGDDVAKAIKTDTADTDKNPVQTVEKPHQVSIQDEIKIAQEVLTRAKQETVQMFQDARMGNSINTEGAAILVDEITQSVSRNAAAMLSITRIKNKDDYTYLHSVAVCALMIALGKHMDYQGDIQSLGMAGLLHDIGKTFIPDEVLNKPGKLTDEEFRIVQEHPLKGWQHLKQNNDVDDICLDVCLHHHERVDGKGYPDKLSGNDLSLVARMGAVCDVYDAITSARCYKSGWEPADALKKMAEWKEGHFDDAVFNAFVKTIGIYPVGTLLKLKSGRLAVVMEQSSKTLLKPKIKIFFSCSSNAPIPTKMIDLSRSHEEVLSIEEPQTWDFDRRHIMDVISN